MMILIQKSKKYIYEKKYLFILSLILIVSLILRLYKIGSKSLWYDEIISIGFAVSNFSFMFLRPNTHPPFYSVSLKFWMFIFGSTVFSMRFFSALCSFLSVYMVFKIAKKLFDVRVALLSAAFTGLSVFHIFYAQDVTNYSLFLLLSLVSIYFYLFFIESLNRKIIFFYGLSTLLCLYTHVFCFSLIILQNIHFLLQRKKKYFKIWFIIQSIFICSFSGWVFLQKPFSVRAVKHISWITPLIVKKNFLNIFSTYSFGGQHLGGYDFVFPLPWYGKLSLPVFVAVIGYFTFFLKKISFIKKETYAVRFFLLWLGAGILIPWVLSLLIRPVFIIRYLIAVSIPFYILVAYGINKISGLYRILCCFLLIFSTSVVLNSYYTNQLKMPWKDVVGYVEETKEKNDNVVVMIKMQDIIYRYYTGDRDFWKNAVEKTESGIKFIKLNQYFFFSIDLLCELRKIVDSEYFSTNSLWIICSPWVSEEEKIKEYCEDSTRGFLKKEFDRITVYKIYKRNIDKKLKSISDFE